MMTDYAYAKLTTHIIDAMKVMTESKVRQLPIIEDDQLVGIVSIGDLTKWIIDAQEQDRQSLLPYIQGDDYTINMNE